ncbi:hypothetical protein F0M18_17950 [Pseudohalioglobus sediminis]|uniref:PLD phosphodiesterase domain-containing protein n=1 Tax=Pseudohalioglobus sediminis TaxID=2606449 RepID=A0A5B0WN29_9GAMM|nr:VTT domain-containing protein [Pseudohalioglobus sediminis]KAA1188382.1 hypothetical protein F0M18_17950 [Pseudohalioglobus sediminis]
MLLTNRELSRYIDQDNMPDQTPGKRQLMTSLFDKPRNCRWIEKADQVGFAVDGENYYRALRESIIGARHSVFLVGWDIHSQLRLVREKTGDGYPTTLAALLEQCVHENPELQIYILCWDFAMIYTLEREFFPRYKLQWKSHDRIHFCLDGAHPAGGSQHQKFAVIDDSVAFAGGLDISKWRWDTREHRANDPRRVDPDGNTYPPFHDVNMTVSGDAARALGQLARERWAAVDGCEPAPAADNPNAECWPESLPPRLQQVEVAIALTRPEWGEHSALHQIEQLYVDSIERAEKLIYIENQYLSSHRIGEALVASLQREQGPEIVIIMPHETGGWLEQHTMDVLRCRLLGKLRDADTHGRLRAFSVRVSRDEAVYVMIHSKTMIIDDRFVRIGSSNLSNRSMGLDSECDLAITDTEDERCKEVITAFRRELLAEHLAVDPQTLAEAEQDAGSVIAAIETLQEGEHTLEALSHEIDDTLDMAVPDSALIDPEKPLEPERMLDYILGSSKSKLATGPLLKVAAALILLLGLAAAWRWTPMSEFLNMESAENAVRWMRDSEFTPALILLAFILGSVLAIPLTLIIIATVTVLGPWAGMAYSLAGAQLAAIVTFWLGQALGKNTVSNLAGSQFNTIARKVKNPGLLTIITFRIVPVAPFTVINVIAGASSISLRDFAIGTFFGMMPGIAAIALVADRLLAWLKDPSLQDVLVLGGTVLLVAGVLWALRHWLGSLLFKD